MMMKKYNLILGCIIPFLAISCSEFLDPYPSAIRDEDYVLESSTAMQGLIDQCYEYMSRNYNNNEGAYLDCATDNAVRTSRTDAISRIAIGVTLPGDDPFQTYWDRDYKGIYNVNLFLKDENGRNTRYMLDEHFDELLRNRLWGEAYALRAWFYWDLLQKFGGKGTDGQLLGVPLILEPVKIWELDPEEIRNIDIKRATYEECVQQIISDCDEAIKYLPKAHRDFLVEDPLDLRILGSRCYGRLDGITMTAVKALAYLTWASPRFNPEGDQTRWENAAKFAKEVIDFKLEVDGAVSNGFAVDKSVNFFNPNDPSIIFASRYNNNNEDMERMFYPDGMQGNGNMGATQELVDAFGMADGYPLGDPRSQYEYDPENPYENRDPRFYSVIFYNGRTISTGAAGDKLYTFENYVGGKDEAERSSRNSLTNYHIKKFVYSGLNWSESSVAKMPHCKFFIRWDHMVLAFAEAANQIGGPNHQIDGLTPKQAISWLRSRPTYDGDPGLVSDPYLDEISLAGKDAFNEFLKNERRIETCFEGTWFFDIRRWSTTLGDLNKPVHRPVITREADGSYTYDYEVIEERTFRSAYLPIPYKEMLNINGLVQNEGWESWQ